MIADPSPTEQLLRRDHVTVGHPQMRHPIQRRASDKHLCCLPLKAARSDSLAKDHLHSKDLRLGQRAAMIATVSLPLPSSLATDRTQVFITDVAFSFRIAVLPDARPLLRWDSRSCCSLSNGVIAVAAIIGPVSRDLRDFVLDLLQQVRQQLRVLETIGRDHDGHKLKGRLVHSEVEFAPGAASGVAVLAHFPFSLAVDLNACGVHHHVQWLRLLPAWQYNFQRAAATAKCRVTWNLQLDAEQLDNRAGQPLGGPQRQAVDLFHSRHAEDGRVGVSGWLAALARARLVVPRRQNILTDPDGQASPPDQSFVILAPVTETVGAFGFLLFHTKRLPVLLSP